MKTLVAAAAATLSLVGFSTSADDSAAVAQAQVAAKSWLALTDGEKYGESWDNASSLFRSAITKADWEKVIKAGRGQLGAMKARKEGRRLLHQVGEASAVLGSAPGGASRSRSVGYPRRHGSTAEAMNDRGGRLPQAVEE